MNPRRACPRAINAVKTHVNCCGQIHTIELRPSGRLAFWDHDYRELANETELRLLADLPPGCRCEVVLRYWRNSWAFLRASDENAAKAAGIGAGFPDSLRDARRSIDARKHLAPVSDPAAVDLHWLHWHDRYWRRTQSDAEAALAQADYRRSESRWAGGKHAATVRVFDPYFEPLRSPNIGGGSQQVWSQNSKYTGTNSYVEATVPVWRWLKRVGLKGLAVVTDRDGKKLFVVDTKPNHEVYRGNAEKNILRPGQIVALVGKQGRGFSVNPTLAIIDTKTKTLVTWQQKNTMIRLPRQRSFEKAA